MAFEGYNSFGSLVMMLFPVEYVREKKKVMKVFTIPYQDWGHINF